jgi:hypothetical protein
MKLSRIFQLLIFASLVSCEVHYAKHPVNGIVAGASIGQNAKKINHTHEGYYAEDVDQATGFEHANRTINSLGGQYIGAGVVKNFQDNNAAVDLGAQGVTKSANANKAATDQLKIKSDAAVEMAKIEPPLP